MHGIVGPTTHKVIGPRILSKRTNSVCGYVAIHTMVNFSYRICKLVFFYFLRSHRTRNQLFPIFPKSLMTNIQDGGHQVMKIDEIFDDNFFYISDACKQYNRELVTCLIVIEHYV